MLKKTYPEISRIHAENITSLKHTQKKCSFNCLYLIFFITYSPSLITVIITTDYRFAEVGGGL